jgi:hypothetical protein
MEKRKMNAFQNAIISAQDSMEGNTQMEKRLA